MPISVLVVDDSALIRQLLSQIILADPALSLVGTAPDAYVAKQMVIAHRPDVITLDIEMPKVDGLRFLAVLMQACPTPVVMISTLTAHGAEATLQALSLGAVEYLAKPRLDVARGVEAYRQQICEKIKIAANAKVGVRKPTTSAVVALPYTGTEKILAIGASTGGTEAIKHIIEALPANAPATIITQHMPPGFTRTFAKRLDAASAMTVSEAIEGARLLPGHAYLAPGDRHLTVVKSGADYRIALLDSERVSGHKPSVDVMFAALAESAGSNAIAVILTGMGKDGAKGMLALKAKGAYTLCQSEATCVVYGMPKVAWEAGAACQQLDLGAIPAHLEAHLNKVGAASRL